MKILSGNAKKGKCRPAAAKTVKEPSHAKMVFGPLVRALMTPAATAATAMNWEKKHLTATSAMIWIKTITTMLIATAMTATIIISISIRKCMTPATALTITAIS